MRKISKVSQEDVESPPTILASRNDAHKPRKAVSVLAMPICCSNTFVKVCRFKPRCQKRSHCCQATQNTKNGSRRRTAPGPSPKKVAPSNPPANTSMRMLTYNHERFNVGLFFAVS